VIKNRAGRYPSGQRGQTVNLLADAFGGSNPPLPTTCGINIDIERGRTTGGNSSAVERQPSKLGVAGSNPVSRSIAARFFPRRVVTRINNRAHVAQLAERVLGKDEVSGSSPDMGSISLWPVGPAVRQGVSTVSEGSMSERSAGG
jgi:hypothetical protein